MMFGYEPFIYKLQKGISVKVFNIEDTSLKGFNAKLRFT